MVTKVILNYLLTIDKKYKSVLTGITLNHFSTKLRNHFNHLSESKDNSINPALPKSHPYSLRQFLAAYNKSLCKRNLVR